MKILLTGMTPRHCGSLRLRMKYAEATSAFFAAITALGHEIVQKVVEFGEDLSSFDRIFVGLHDMNAIATGTKQLVGVAHCANSAFHRCVAFYDDWSGMETDKSAETMIRTWAKRKPYLQGRGNLDETRLATIYGFADMLAKGTRWPANLIPAFPWADRDKLAAAFPPSNATNFWDPTVFTDVLDDIPLIDGDVPRRRAWFNARLQNNATWVKKQNFSWPVSNVGLKGEVVLSEGEVKHAYRLHRGVLATKYAAPGWWRARFYHAAKADAILYCDATDQIRMGDAYQLSNSSWIESAEDSALDHRARNQSEWILSRVTSRDKVLAGLATFFG